MIIITFHYRYRKQLIIAAVIILIISIITIVLVTNNKKVKVKKDSTIVKKTSSIKKNSSNEETSVEYKIDIKGEVINPGIYTMKSSSRIIDQTTPNMIQRIIGIFERKPLISKEI